MTSTNSFKIETSWEGFTVIYDSDESIIITLIKEENKRWEVENYSRFIMK